MSRNADESIEIKLAQMFSDFVIETSDELMIDKDELLMFISTLLEKNDISGSHYYISTILPDLECFE